MEAIFSRAAASVSPRSDQPVVLGLRLRPLMVGHQFLLLSLGSPFVDHAAPLALPDFFTAIFICAHPWRSAEKLLRSRWLPLYFALWQFTQRRAHLNLELGRFRSWYEEQIATPAFRAPKENAPARPAGAPRPWIRLVFLLNELGLSEAASLDMSVQRANALYATWLDWTGKAELLITPEMEGLLKFAAAQDAQKFNPDGSRKAQETEGPITKVQGSSAAPSFGPCALDPGT